MTQTQNNIKILLVCDNEPDIINIKAHVEGSKDIPCYVWPCPTLSDGMDYLNHKKLRADIIILDLGLIGTDNPKDVYEKMGEAAHGIPIIILTGKGTKEHDIAVLVMQAGAADNLIRGEFGRLNDAMEFALIRQEIAKNVKSKSDKTLQDSKDEGDAEHKKISDKRQADEQKHQDSLSMLMGDYSAPNHDARAIEKLK